MHTHIYIGLKFILIIGFVFILASCSVEKYIPDDELLYTGASLEIASDSLIKNVAGLKVSLEQTFRPEPNSKFLGMRPGLFYYYKMQQEKPGWLTKWLYKQWGEEQPVYRSDVEAYEVENLLLNRLENRGFFYSKAVSKFEEDTLHKSASVKYTVDVPTPYLLKKYELDTLPLPIYRELQSSVASSKIVPGMRFDLSNMKLERERIDNDLKQKGYYNFNPGFLIFEADTNQYDNKQFDLFLKLKKDVPEKAILPYTITKVNIHPNYSIQRDSFQLDTVRFKEKNFIQEEAFFKPKYLDPYVLIEEGQVYDPVISKNTARRLSTIGAYKFVNIQYKEIDSLQTDSTGVLEATIYLSPLNKRAVRAELQAVTKSNNFAGPGIELTYSNRNLFKGGEILNIIGSGAYEVQAGGGGGSGLSSIQLGLKGEVVYPRLLFPLKINSDFFKYDIPKTKTSLAIDYLSRGQLYTLLSGTAQFGYTWRANRYVTHEIIPISVNYTKLSNTTAEFDEILIDNPFLARSFEQQFIAGLNYAFTYNGMVDTQKKHQIYLRSTFDIAGNTVGLFGQEQGEGEPKTFIGTEYAQYAKLDADVRYHYNFGKEQVIATRLFGGYGYAYGNSTVLPFIKQYYAGGPYSVRAFRIRSLGPGTFAGNVNENGTVFDQIGNIRLEANIEYRFPIFSYLKGALFADAGNIWISEENADLPGGKFTSNFINELGMGAGFGLRVDVQGFVIRFDLAAPFHDPKLPEGERLDFRVDEPVFNFAIGYPF
ncbi:BamA/TamA family outer membrane protein [Rasiella sp. SM2506]|uniref:translocation and assembly module lipoprotein TamL n=1 Tax=Rasiella sp. SM2506 TaxID=3423914 RepID=UPI003D7939D9